MNTHSIDLIRYCARSRGNSTIYLGTAGSHGNEQLQVTRGKGWEGLTVQVVFHPCKVAVQLPANGVLDVPWEATARPLTALQGRIVFQGFDQDRLVNSTDLAYTVASHSPALGRDEQPYTPGIVEGVLNQMAADKDAILQAAQQTGQAKEAAAASAAEAASSAANAQQSAGAANTSAGQAAASASQAAGSAAAANETLTQVQTAGQEAQQKVKDAETEALGNISAAAPALPAVSAAAAWQSVTAKPDGTGYNLAAMAPIEATIRPTVTGNPAVCKDSAAWAFQGLKIYGKSTQDGTPSPENPVPIVSAGNGGSVDASLSGINMMNYFLVKDYGTIRNCNISLDGNVFVFTAKADGDSYFGGQILIKSGETYPEKSKKLLFPVTPGEKLKIVVSNSYFKTPAFCFVKKDFTVISFSGGSFSITVPEDAAYATARLGNASAKVSDGTQYTTFMVCREEYNDNFVPYQDAQTLSISTPNGLPGIPVESGGTFTDADGQQWICNIKDYGAGKYTQNCVSAVFDGSDDENWILESVASLTLIRFSISVVDIALNPIGLCDRLPWTITPTTSSKTEQIGGNPAQARLHVIISKDRLSDTTVSGFKAWLASNPLEVIYQLATPIETDIPAEELAAYKALATYDGTTLVSTAEPVAGIEASYVMDGNKYRESVDKRLAALEAAQTGI